MRIGIMTWVNEGCNCGQSLQGYALQEVFCEDDFEVTIINYKHEFPQKKYRNIIAYNLKLFVNALGHSFVKWLKFQKFEAKYLRTSRKLFNKKQIEKYLCKNRIKNLVTGSDQIWNPNAYVNYPESEIEIYLLDFVGTYNKFSYSPSMCAIQDSHHFHTTIKKIANLIKDFNYIGVREDAAKKILDKYMVSKTHVLVDPVFLLNSSTWDRKLKIKHKKEVRYVLVCAYNGKRSDYKKYVDYVLSNNAIKEAIYITKEYNKDFSSTRGYFPNISPTEFVQYISNAEYLICDSFHAMSFALIYRIPFLVLDFQPKEKSTMFRCSELLNKIGLSDRFIIDSECDLDNIEIDTSSEKYDDAIEKLNVLIEYSKNELKYMESLME